MEKITKRAVDALKPNRVGIKVWENFLWDRELRGFGVRVSPTGLKVYLIQYRNPEGKSRRLSLGRHGLLTPEQARDLAREKLVLIARGEDPNQAAEIDRNGMTIGQVCDWYLAEAEAGRLLGRRRKPIKPSTLAMDRSRIESHVRPLLGSRRLASLKLLDIEGMQADVAAGKTAKPRAGSRGGATTGGAGTAARTVSTLHSLLEHALRLGLIERNPAKGVRKLASEPRDRRLSAAEITALGQALRKAEQDGEHPTGVAAIRLLLLTGFRRSEALGLHRTWVDAEVQAVRFPDTKTGAQIRPIGRAALDLIQSQPRRDGSAFVFPSDWGEGHFTAVVAVLDRACAAARLQGVTPHTLRHTFASVAADLGFTELTIAALLGHAARGVTQRYVHVDEAVRMAADRVAERIDQLLAGGKLANQRSSRRQRATPSGPASLTQVHPT